MLLMLPQIPVIWNVEHKIYYTISLFVHWLLLLSNEYGIDGELKPNLIKTTLLLSTDEN